MDIYTFSLNEEPAGIFGCEVGPEIIAMNAVFAVGDDIFENPFYLRHRDGELLAYRVSDEPWINTSSWPGDRFPTSAYPLLLPRVRDHYQYDAIHEGTRESLGPTILRRDGNQITEIRDDRPTRIFELDDDGEPVRIDWMGAVSRRVQSADEALEDLEAGSRQVIEEIFNKWRDSVENSQ